MASLKFKRSLTEGRLLLLSKSFTHSVKFTLDTQLRYASTGNFDGSFRSKNVENSNQESRRQFPGGKNHSPRSQKQDNDEEKTIFTLDEYDEQDQQHKRRTNRSDGRTNNTNYNGHINNNSNHHYSNNYNEKRRFNTTQKSNGKGEIYDIPKIDTEFNKVRQSLRDTKDQPNFDPLSFSNFRKVANPYQLLYKWEEKQKELDKNNIHKHSPHDLFFDQLEKWEKLRKFARMKDKGGVKFTNEETKKMSKILDQTIQEKVESDPHFTSLDAEEIPFSKVEVDEEPEYPNLAHNLDRVLFSPGVHVLKDGRTNVYNFSPSLESVMSIRDFDFTKVTPFIPSSQDDRLSSIAASEKKKFTASTSSLTSILMHFHYLLSNNRPPSIEHLSKTFPKTTTTFTASMRKPVSIFLRYRPETNTYAVDSDKSQDEEIILSLLGHVMETQLTVDADTFQRVFTKPFENEEPSSEPFDAINTYHYSVCEDFVMRSQIDCYDSRLPGTGVFDLKTRAVCAVRHDLDYAQINDGSDYQLTKIVGEWESYEREQYDLVRSALLKYSLQARIGRMDGIFIAYHNIRKMFGFEYLPLTSIDKIFHSYGYPKSEFGSDEIIEKQSTVIADSEFKFSIKALSKLLNNVIERYPKKSVNIILKAPTNEDEYSKLKGKMVVIAHPMEEKYVDLIQKGLPLPPPTPRESAYEENLLKHQATKTTKSEYSAYLNRHTMFDLYKNEYNGPLLDFFGWEIQAINFIDGELMPNTNYPIPKPDQKWTAAVRMVPISAPTIFKKMNYVISESLKEIANSEKKLKSLSRRKRALTEEDEDELDMSSNDESTIEESKKYLTAVTPELLAAANELAQLPVKRKGRLTSSPDTVRRSKEEISEYLEKHLKNLPEPSDFQKMLRKYDEKGKALELDNEMKNANKEKIVWSPK